MTIENLPRPWVLAALTGLRIEELLAADGSGWQQPSRGLPRPERRRPDLREAVSRERTADGDPARLN